VLLVLFAAIALALRDVLRQAVREPARDAPGAGPARARPIMRVFLITAWIASLWGGEASRALLTALGLAASATLASRLADDEPGARLVASLVGVITFGSVSILGPRLPAWAAAVGAYPVLVALPLAWAALWAWNTVAPKRAG